MLGNQLVEATKQYALFGPLVVQAAARTYAIDRRTLSAEVDSLGQKCFWGVDFGKFGGRRITVELEEANVGAHPLFVAAGGHLEFAKARPSSRPHVAEPSRLVASCEEGIKSLL